MRMFSAGALVGWFALMTAVPLAQPRTDGPPPAQVDVLSIESRALKETRTTWIGRSGECTKEAPCDVLVVLDANALYPLALSYASVMRTMGRMPALLIVGVPSRSPADRFRILTPAPGADERARYPQAGDAPRFRQFLEDELLPSISKDYAVSARRVIAGHSLAGLFVLDALASGSVFNDYVAISPTLGWNGQHTVSALGAKLAGRNTARRAYVSVANDTSAYLDAFTRLEGLVTQANSPWLGSRFERFADDDHVTTIAPGLHSAMKWLFVTPAP